MVTFSKRFYFHGFLNPVENKAKQELEDLQDRKETLIFYESPHRIDKTIKTLYKVLGNRDATIARELTKILRDTGTMNGKITVTCEQIEKLGLL